MSDSEFRKAVNAAESTENARDLDAELDDGTARAKRILQGLGFCGHYMHFHGGGRSGQVPIVCMLDRCGRPALTAGTRLAL